MLIYVNVKCPIYNIHISHVRCIDQCGTNRMHYIWDISTRVERTVSTISSSSGLPKVQDPIYAINIFRMWDVSIRVERTVSTISSSSGLPKVQDHIYAISFFRMWDVSIRVERIVCDLH